MPSPLSGASVHRPPVQVSSPLPFLIMALSGSRPPSRSCHGAASGCCRTAELAPPMQRLAPNKKGPGAGRPDWFWQGRSEEKEPMRRSLLFRGAANFPFSLFPVPCSLFPGLPPTTASWFWHGASTDIRQCARPPPIARGTVRRSGISWPGAGKPTVDQTRFTATAASSPLKWSLLSPLASMFHVSQTPPHARGARATEPAPLVRIRHGSRHHVHDITCSGTGSGTAERHCSVVPRRPGKKDRTPADPEPDRRSTVLTVAITTSPSAAVSTQRCQILACEAIKSCLFIHKSQSGPQLLPCPMLRGRVYVMLLSARVAQEGSWPSPRHVHQVGLHPRCFPRPAQI